MDRHVLSFDKLVQFSETLVASGLEAVSYFIFLLANLCRALPYRCLKP